MWNRAAIITYLNPLVAVVIGMLVLGERLGVTSFAGLLLVVGGAWLSTGSRGHVEVTT